MTSRRMGFRENVVLAPYTTLGVGGAARWFVEAANDDDIFRAADFARQKRLPLFVLGGGSNLLVADSGYNGLVVRLVSRGIKETASSVRDKRQFSVEAGENWDRFVDFAVGEGLGGVECLAGIPGTVGGTPIQNVGAYGQEVAGVILRVRGLDLDTMQWKELAAAECDFGYRRSRFNSEAKGRSIVTQVDFQLQVSGLPQVTYPDLKRHFKDREPGLGEVADAVRDIRRAKGMLLVKGDLDCRSAGSFFKNPVIDEGSFLEIARAAGTVAADVPNFPAGPGKVKLPAAWLVEKAGFSKGFRMGQAAISSRHTLALTNLGGATAGEIVALRDRIVAGVEGKFGIRLRPEPVLLGEL